MSQESEHVPDSWELKKQVRTRLILLGGAWFGAMCLSIVVLYSIGLAQSPPAWLEYLFPAYWAISILGTTGLGLLMISEARRVHSMAGFGIGVIATLLPTALLCRSVAHILRELYQYWN